MINENKGTTDERGTDEGAPVQRVVIPRWRLLLVYAGSMALGWMCYWPVILWPETIKENNKIFLWLLQWAGFYAYVDDFDQWARRRTRAV